MTVVLLSGCSSHRETMLQALRFVIQGAGSKVDPAIRKNITTTLLSMLGHDEVRREEPLGPRWTAKANGTVPL